jgi:UDP-GlcNAc3NAcA epimerase
MLEAIEEVLLEQRPDWVLVYGDTNSTLAGALAAAKVGIPVAHVEAGLRSFNRAMPEEVNRVITDHISSLLFAPTSTATAHLDREGISADRCALVGDVMYDIALKHGKAPRKCQSLLAREGLTTGEHILATMHRAENTDSPERLSAIIAGLATASLQLPVILPLHPRTRVAIEAAELGVETGQRLRFIAPVGYRDMLELEQGARLIVTDSGGVQKEAYFHGAPCLTLRDETEWTELVESGWNRLVPPTSAGAVATAVRDALGRPNPSNPAEPLYGGGAAAERIAALLAESPGHGLR